MIIYIIIICVFCIVNMEKTYKSNLSEFIGAGGKVDALDFGEDRCYSAHIVEDAAVDIPDYYSRVFCIVNFDIFFLKRFFNYKKAFFLLLEKQV